MNKKFRSTMALIGFSVLTVSSGLVQAEKANYTCSYTKASYTAPFEKEVSIRNCPEGRCSYTVTISGSSAIINGVSGFSVEQSDSMVKLSRTAKDPIMGGMDTTVLTINKSDMSFENVKTTTPSVVLKTQGTCQ
ncbi:MAG: hypothetical protein ACPF9K_02515 [Neptuniibacter sp.]